jgi:hypothetical protein
MGKKIDVAVIGSKGGAARAANLSAQERAEASSRASNARWDVYYASHPEKLKAKLERAKKASSRKKAAK